MAKRHQLLPRTSCSFQTFSRPVPQPGCLWCTRTWYQSSSPRCLDICIKTALEPQEDVHVAAAFGSIVRCKDKKVQGAARGSCKAVGQAQLWFEQVNLHRDPHVRASAELYLGGGISLGCTQLQLLHSGTPFTLRSLALLSTRAEMPGFPQGLALGKLASSPGVPMGGECRMPQQGPDCKKCPA